MKADPYKQVHTRSGCTFICVVPDDIKEPTLHRIFGSLYVLDKAGNGAPRVLNGNKLEPIAIGGPKIA